MLAPDTGRPGGACIWGISHSDIPSREHGGSAIPEHEVIHVDDMMGPDDTHAVALRPGAEPSPDRNAPLAGYLVLDATRVLAGPYSTMLLADLGAEVIKVERPGTGDDSRSFGPFKDGSSAYFASVNRGKKSVTLDLRSDEGKDVFRSLARQADILVENFRPGVMDRLGLGWRDLRTLNPKLIYASCSGFGQTGPYAQRPAYDIVVQAMGGLLGITGEEGGGPVRVGVSLGDLSGALFLVTGILAAALQRERTGEGQFVDVAMLDSVVALLENAIVRHDLDETAPGPLGTRHPSISPFQAFAAADGYVVVAAGNDRLWKRLCDLLGDGSLAADRRFATNEGRNRYHSELERSLSRHFAMRTVQEWLPLLEDAGIPCSPVNGVDSVVADRQVEARGMLMHVSDGGGNRFRVASNPVRLSSRGVRPRGWVPGLGEHTAEVLRERLGLDEGAIQALRSRAAI
jgi:CoA:oxalate CoA-transferase